MIPAAGRRPNSQPGSVFAPGLRRDKGLRNELAGGTKGAIIPIIPMGDWRVTG